MNNQHRARIRFLSAEEGGRTTPPTGPIYSTVARFNDMSDTLIHDDVWSIVVTFGERSGYEMVVGIEFLSPHAPHMLLREGACFQLLEGKRVVARGEIITST
jgi:hypothetical protein